MGNQLSVIYWQKEHETREGMKGEARKRRGGKKGRG